MDGIQPYSYKLKGFILRKWDAFRELNFIEDESKSYKNGRVRSYNEIREELNNASVLKPKSPVTKKNREISQNYSNGSLVLIILKLLLNLIIIQK